MVFVKQLMTGGSTITNMYLRNSLQVSALHPWCGQYGAFLMAGSSLKSSMWLFLCHQKNIQLKA